jgi:hypothetical protein
MVFGTIYVENWNFIAHIYYGDPRISPQSPHSSQSPKNCAFETNISAQLWLFHTQIDDVPSSNSTLLKILSNSSTEQLFLNFKLNLSQDQQAIAHNVNITAKLFDQSQEEQPLKSFNWKYDEISQLYQGNMSFQLNSQLMGTNQICFLITIEQTTTISLNASLILMLPPSSINLPIIIILAIMILSAVIGFLFIIRKVSKTYKEHKFQQAEIKNRDDNQKILLEHEAVLHELEESSKNPYIK